MIAAFLIAAAATLSAEPLHLKHEGSVFMDYLAYDAANHRLWIPAGNTGHVDVLDTESGKLETIAGFPTKQQGKRTMGPTAAAAGDGHVYVGNRADQSICAVNAKTLAREGCVTLEASPDGVVYVGATKEVWVTTPHVQQLVVLSLKDPSKPELSGKITLAGDPEGYAVDEQRGIFYTNLEDKDRTLAIDAKERKVVATWDPACGEKGPRGLALDGERRHLFVACARGVVKSLDAGKEGAVLGEVEAGAGLDNIDYQERTRLLYAASGKEGALTVAKAEADGKLEKIAHAATTPGGRTVIIDSAGRAYIPDSKNGRVMVVKAPTAAAEK